MEDIGLIIPCAGKINNPITSVIGYELNDAMLPINGKPLLAWNIDSAAKNLISEVVILTNKESYIGIKKYIDLVYKNRSLKISVKEVNTKSLGETILHGLLTSNKSKNLIVLGDTIYTGTPENLDENWLTYRTDYNQKSRWCRIKIDPYGYISDYIDKVDDNSTNLNIVSGVYFIKDKEAILNSLKSNNFYIYKALSELKLKAIDEKNVFDCGHIDNYYKTKTELFGARAFNKMIYNPIFGTIKKTSLNKSKIEHEINWFKNLPTKIRIFAPRLLDYSYEDPISYELEYYGYNTLHELHIANSLEKEVWKSIFKNLISLWEEFKKYTSPSVRSDLYEMYINKTLTRINEASKNEQLSKIFNITELKINGINYKGFNQIKEKVEKKVLAYIDTVDKFTIIHGDMSFSNILFDINSRIFKLIDPRGSFGKEQIYGDPNYDLAKLRHCIHGNYDFIVSDMFNLKQEENSFLFNMPIDNRELVSVFDDIIKEVSNLESIKLIEGLLFISMIPLHYENINRQIAMYLMGVMLLNEVIKCE
jgi:hypothetical protein